MDTLHNIDPLDEALRVIFLESAKDEEDSLLDRYVPALLSSTVDIVMPGSRKDLFLQKLKDAAFSLSFGQVLQQAMSDMLLPEEVVAGKVNLPVKVVNDLSRDLIYTNNVPIVLLKNLLSVLNLSFRNVESAIRKTFEILQSSQHNENMAISEFKPAFRKGHYVSGQKLTSEQARPDGKELFENKEALDKYLNRLQEIMKQ